MGNRSKRGQWQTVGTRTGGTKLKRWCSAGGREAARKYRMEKYRQKNALLPTREFCGKSRETNSEGL